MKKGFTLIELLAVIVILAVIAIIATPIVLNIINDTKESAILRSADFYLNGVEKSIATSVLNNIQIPDATYPIMNDGNVCIGKLEDNTCAGNILEVFVEGEKPNNGTVKIKEGKIVDTLLNLSDKVILKSEKNEYLVNPTLANYIKNLYSETKTTIVNGIEYSLDEAHSLMNDRLGNKEVSKYDGNIRYYGAIPNNYIDIGDRDSEGNIIFWRIIGVFKDIEVTDENDNVTKTEDLVKIIRADKLIVGSINGFSWDCKYDGTTISFSNVWSTSTLKTMLNDEKKGYYGSGTISYYNNSTTAIELNFASIGLSPNTHSKIARVNWNLGEIAAFDVSAAEMYKYERVEGLTTWSGKIALMYPSDYGYSADLSSCQTTLNAYNDSNCKTTNWLYDSAKSQWTPNPLSSHTYHAIDVNLNGYVRNNGVLGVYGVRPVLYLNSDVGIVEEKETSEGLKYFVVE